RRQAKASKANVTPKNTSRHFSNTAAAANPLAPSSTATSGPTQQRDAVIAARTLPPSVAFCRAFDLSINVFVRFGRTYGLYLTRGSRAFFEFLLGAIGWDGSPAN